MNMRATKAESAELKTEAFEFFKCPSASVDMRLLQKAVVSTLGHEHHRDPIISSVRTDMFKASASYVCHVLSP